MRGHVRVDGSRVWPVDRDLAAVALADRVQHAQRFGVQPAGVQREHLQVSPASKMACVSTMSSAASDEASAASG